jgi:hypothetical protein
MSGISVIRNWLDSDTRKEGRDETVTDQTGTSQFSMIPANVGVVEHVLSKIVGFFGSCSPGSGTQTRILVSYSGRYDVVPRGKELHRVGMVSRDSDGVWFGVGTDSQSNTWVQLTFPERTKTIDYVLLSRRRAE